MGDPEEEEKDWPASGVGGLDHAASSLSSRLMAAGRKDGMKRVRRRAMWLARGSAELG